MNLWDMQTATRHVMNDYEKLVPLECRNAVDAFIDTARGLLEKDGELAPVALVGRFEGGGVIVPHLNRLPKDFTTKIIRLAAQQSGADYALFVTECWLKEMDFKTPEEARDYYNRRQHEGGPAVSEMPGRIDAVRFQLETYTGTFSAHCAREGSEGAYTFGKPEFRMEREAIGRFVGMLPPRGPTQ